MPPSKLVLQSILERHRLVPDHGERFRPAEDRGRLCVAHRRIGSNERLRDVVAVVRREMVGEIDASGLYGTVAFRVYPWTASYTTARYLDLLDTYSDHALLAPAHRASLYQAIAEAIERRAAWSRSRTCPWLSWRDAPERPGFP